MTSKTWKSSENFWPLGNTYCAVIPLPPEYPGPCTVPCTVDGSFPMFSMMSISPQVGQPTEEILSPSIQKAGHSPCPNGILIRSEEHTSQLQSLRHIVC